MTAPIILSVAILTFNRARTLRETLHSLVEQVPHEGVELLVCDNASTDDTRSAVAEYESRCAAIRYHRNPQNTGFDGNIVSAVRYSRGDYVAFFSDDDIAAVDYLRTLLRELQDVKPEIVYINHIPFFHDRPDHCGKPLLPVTRRVFASGEEFILAAGLGFISALVVKRNSALKFADRGEPESGCTHLAIAYHVALTTPGPFLYNGTLFAYARYSYGGGPVLQAGCLNEALLMHELRREKLVSEHTLQGYLRWRALHLLPRHAFVARARSQHVRFTTLRRIFGDRASLWLLVAPIYAVPSGILRMLYRIIKRALHAYRAFRFPESRSATPRYAPRGDFR
jgi:glycosyltransferase involved in cell wall biosynthesis